MFQRSALARPRLALIAALLATTALATPGLAQNALPPGVARHLLA